MGGWVSKIAEEVKRHATPYGALGMAGRVLEQRKKGGVQDRADARAAQQQMADAEAKAIVDESAAVGAEAIARKRKMRAASLLATSANQAPQTTLLGG